LHRGHKTTILPYNLTVFDPTWNDLDTARVREKLKASFRIKKRFPVFEEVTQAYLDYFALGGQFKFKVITPTLIRTQLKSGTPILTSLSATYLYNDSHEVERHGKWVADDARGYSCGHFVVPSGYRKEKRTVQVTDPLVPNPMADDCHYDVDIYRLVCAIMRGVLTYDGNLLIIQKK
jgi:hypothetical protein